MAKEAKGPRKRKVHAQPPRSTKKHHCMYRVVHGDPKDKRFKMCGKVLTYYAFRTHLKTQHLEPTNIAYKSMIKQYSSVMDKETRLSEILVRLDAVETVLVEIARKAGLNPTVHDYGSEPGEGEHDDGSEDREHEKSDTEHATSKTDDSTKDESDAAGCENEPEACESERNEDRARESSEEETQEHRAPTRKFTRKIANNLARVRKCTLRMQASS